MFLSDHVHRATQSNFFVWLWSIWQHGQSQYSKQLVLSFYLFWLVAIKKNVQSFYRDWNAEDILCCDQKEKEGSATYQLQVKIECNGSGKVFSVWIAVYFI